MKILCDVIVIKYDNKIMMYYYNIIMCIIK